MNSKLSKSNHDYVTRSPLYHGGRCDQRAAGVRGSSFANTNPLSSRTRRLYPMMKFCDVEALASAIGHMMTPKIT